MRTRNWLVRLSASCGLAMTVLVALNTSNPLILSWCLVWAPVMLYQTLGGFDR